MSQIDLTHLAALQRAASALEPEVSEFQEWSELTVAYGAEYLKNINETDAYHDDFSLIEHLETYKIQEEGMSLPELISALQQYVDKPGINPAAPGHLGYIPGGGIYASSIADFIAAFTNPYAGIFYGGPGAVKIENMLIRWMLQLFGYPDTGFGNLTSGGSIANLTAIVTARDAKEIYGERLTRSVIYLTHQTHHCVHKALKIAGLAHCQIRNIQTDSAFRMDAEELNKKITEDKAAGLIPFMIVASIGTTDVGAVDPIDEIADIAEAHDCWFHIDAAYGGFFILVDELRHLFSGVHRSDSLVVDPHKSMFLPYGSGVVLLKDAHALNRSHEYEANYMQDAFSHEVEWSPADVSAELTKHFRGLRFWLPLQMHGLAPFRACLAEKWQLALYFHEKIQALGFEVGPTPELSVAIYRYVHPDIEADVFNQALAKSINLNTKLFVSTTTISGQFWLRAAIVNFRTHQDTLDVLLGYLEEVVPRMVEELS